MSTKPLIYLSIPGLRPCDVADSKLTPTLSNWAANGVQGDIVPSFPCVTSTVQASTWTGVGPDKHGIIANGFYHRNRMEVEFWVGRNDVVQSPQIWDSIRRAGLTSAVWHAQNIKDAAADFIVTPAPIHHADGRTELWCYSKPEGLYRELLDALGHFPLQHYWGPLANIESTQWILNGAKWLIERHSPGFHFIYVPHLDYASQKFGPNSPQAQVALRELDAALAPFAEFVADVQPDATVLAVSEYAMTEVTGAIFPNKLLRAHGWLKTRETADGEVIDYAGSRAFAMVDHQCAHLYVREGRAEDAAALFRDVEGIEGVWCGKERAAIGMDHARSGEVILSSRADRWFAYYWWLDDVDAPPFARTVDIHRKPGYDPVELFFDPATRTIPLNASLIRGSHGAIPLTPRQRGAVISSVPTGRLQPARVYRDTEIISVILDLLGLEHG